MSDTVRDVVRSFLIASGVRKIFGNPGSTEMRFFKDWPDDLDYVMVPRETPWEVCSRPNAMAPRWSSSPASRPDRC
jgi:hypothetical protein